jgi:signal transduction histidine kinase
LLLLVRAGLVLALLLSGEGGLYAQPPVPHQLPTEVNRIRLDDRVAIYIDSTGQASFTDVQSRAAQQKFVANAGRSLVFGYLPHPIWLRIVLSSEGRGKKWYLELPAPYLEYVDFYQQHYGTWQGVFGGYYRPHADRGVPHTGFALPLIFNEEGNTTVFIRIAGDSPKTFPLYAVEEAAFIADNERDNIGYGIFFGILGVMFFFNLIIGLTLRQMNYLLYVCTIFCSFLVFASASGYASKYLWPNLPAMNFYAGRLILGPFAVFLALFAIRFLETRKYSTFFHYVLLVVIPLAVLSTVLVATGVKSSAGNNLLAITCLILIAAGIVCRVRGNRLAIYFIAAWTFYLFGGLMLLLRNAGVFESNFWTTHLPEIGAAVETIIIAFALGDRYRQFKKEKEQAQHLALQVQREANEKLERTVAERTEQLRETVNVLNDQLLRNEEQTKIIRQKNAELDAFVYGVSHDLKSPVASLLSLTALAKADVDHPTADQYFIQQEHELTRLNAIIRDLMTITRIEHEAPKRDVIDFEKMVADCLQALRGLSNFASVRVEKEIEPTPGLKSEWIFLNNILQNLLENAVKYAGDHDPFVRIRISRMAHNLVIEVTDNGLGIAPEFQSRIFDMFFRATDRSHGTGLGLFILKRSVDRLKGAIEVESVLGRGSTFRVLLPC